MKKRFLFWVQVYRKQPKQLRDISMQNFSKILSICLSRLKAFKQAEASFEEKNRPRNLAITAILLYCGLKIHEVVELKRKDVSLTKQILNLNRKENRLNKVPIPKEAMPFLENYFKLTAQNTDENSFVFVPHMISKFLLGLFAKF